MPDIHLDPSSPYAVRASRLAREMLTARASKDRALLDAALTGAVQAVTEDPDMVPYLVAAQNFLCFAAICQAVGADLEDEDFDTVMWDRIGSLAVALDSHGWTFG